MPPPSQISPSGLMAVIPAVRVTSQLAKSLRSRSIAATTLAAYDEHFKTIMASYPEPYPIHSTAPLDPRLLVAATALQTSRFFLYRHNLSIGCKKAERRDALDRCVSAAKDTAHYISRTMQQPSGAPGHVFHSSTQMQNWASQVRLMSPAFYCTHVWRCALVSILKAEYSTALTLVQISAAVGDLRSRNVACGRYMAFFLDRVIERLRAGVRQEVLEMDEEMLAYASGDLQGVEENAWAWAGGQPPSQSLSTPDHFPRESRVDDGQKIPVELTEQEAAEWGGWEHICNVLAQMEGEQQEQYIGNGQGQHPSAPAQSAYPPQAPQAPMAPIQRPNQLPSIGQPPQGEEGQHHLAPQPMAPMNLRPSPSPAPSNSGHSSSGVGSGNGSNGNGNGNGNGNSNRHGNGNGNASGGGSSRISIQDIM